MAIEQKFKKPTDKEMLKYWQAEKRRYSEMKNGANKRENLKVINSHIKHLSEKIAEAKAMKPTKEAPVQKTTTYTVGGKTFATKAEARAYKALQKQRSRKPCEIKESTRKPSHRIVSFTAKK